MVFLHALEGILGLVLLGAVGFALAARGWFGAETRILLPRLITRVALPPFLMYTIMHAFERDRLLELLQGSLLPLASIVLSFVLAWGLGRLCRVDGRHFGLFCASVANSNTIFVGVPVNLALFGEASLPYVLLYYFANTVFLWTAGQYAIARDVPERSRAIPARIRLGQVFSPPLLGFLLGLALTLCGVGLPDCLQTVARQLGNLTTPLALLFIGISIHDMGARSLRVSKDMALLLAGRMCLAPLLMWGLLRLADVPPLMGRVFVIQASLPVVVQAAVLSAQFRTDAAFGAQAVTLSTLLSIVTVPLLMVLL